jgi:hypothetical protein
MYLGMTEQEPRISSEHRGYCWCYPYEIGKLLTYETKMVIFRKALAHLRAKGLLRPEDEIKQGRSLRPQRPKQTPPSQPLHRPHGKPHGMSMQRK